MLAVLLLEPQDPHLDRAHAAEATRDFATAAREYEQSLARRPDAAKYLRLGLVRHLQNHFAQAIPALESSLKLDPGQWAARLFLGIDLYRTNQFARALPELAKAAKLKPGDTEIQFWTGVTQLALKQYFTGLANLEAVAQRQPGNLEVFRLLAENYASFGASLVNTVAERYPDTAAGLTVHAQALEFEGADQAALETYRAIAEKWPDRPGVGDAIVRLQNATSARPQLSR